MGIFLLLQVLNAAELHSCTASDLIQNSNSESSTQEEVLFERKKVVFDALLTKFNALVRPEERVSSIPWNRVHCTGWPNEVNSKYTKDWTLQDLQILEGRVPEIQFALTEANEMADSAQMLQGSYSNPSFDRFSQNYHLISVIGIGSYGFVMEGIRVSDSRKVAIKFIHQPLMLPRHWTQNPVYGRVPVEVDILSKVSHPGIVRLLDYFDDGTYGYLVTEIFGARWTLLNHELSAARNPGLRLYSESEHYDENSPRDLFECINSHDHLSENIINSIFSQIYRVVLYLHRNGICHGDLKPENVLIDADYRIKLIDFGLARVIPRDELGQEGLLVDLVGTEVMIAPEMLNQVPYRASETETFSLGVLLFVMAHFDYPFKSREETVEKEFTFSPTEGAGIYDLMEKMLIKDPSKRIKLKEIALHPWMNSYNQKVSGNKRSSVDK